LTAWTRSQISGVRLAERDVATDAGVVDEHVEAAELHDRGVDHAAQIVVARDVGRHEGGAAAGTVDRAYDLATFRRHVGDHDRRALARETLRDRAADAVRCTRHDRHPFLEPPHGRDLARRTASCQRVVAVVYMAACTPSSPH
jgi:hypothetical protein